MRTLLIMTICFFASCKGNSQNIEYFDANWKPTTKGQAAYYREINYDENGKPKGVVKDYYITGELQFEGQMISVNPEKLDGTCIWYYKNGQKSQETVYEKGKIIGESNYWDKKGGPEGYLKRDGYFWSKETLDRHINQLPFNTNENLNSSEKLEKAADFFILSGSAYLLENKIEIARFYFQLAHDVYFNQSNKKMLAYCFMMLGKVYKTKYNFKKSIEYYNIAQEIQHKLNFEKDKAITLSELGEAYRSIGLYKEGEECYNQSIDIYKKLGLEYFMAQCFGNLAGVYKDQGNYDFAFKFYYMSIEILEKLDLKKELASIYNNLAILYETQEKFDEALFWIDKAILKRQELINMDEIELINQHEETEILNTISNLDELPENLKGYFVKWEKRSIQKKLATSLNIKGGIFQSLGKYEEATKWLEKSIEVKKNLNLKEGLAISYMNLGLTLHSQNKNEEALTMFYKAKQIQEDLNLELDLAWAFNNIGYLHSSQGNSEEALNWYSKAIGIREKLNQELGLAISYNNKGLVYFNEEQLDSALFYAQKCIHLREKLRKQNKGNINRRLFVDNILSSVEVAVNSSYELKYWETSFTISEKSKSRGLIDLLNEVSVNVKNLSKDILSKISINEYQLNSIVQKLSTNISVPRRKQLISQRDSINSIRIGLQDQIKTQAPEYANLIYPETVTSKQIQSILNQEEVIVSYYIGDLNTYTFIITNSKLVVIDLGATEDLSSLIEKFRDKLLPQQRAYLTSRTQSRLKLKGLNKQFFQLSHQLYQKLWAPIESTGLLSKNKKVFLVPDGYLNYLPFELLIKDTEQKELYKDYQYLVKDYLISYYPSATVFHFERTNKKGGPIPEKDFFGLAISNFENSFCSQDGSPLGNLEGTVTSIDTIKEFFDEDKRKTIYNEEASEDNFNNLSLNDFRYLHLATHGLINSDSPDFSSIVLQSGGDENGCLNLYEIFDLEFNADLVTLSACETGLGKLVRGEGMVGFTRALMYAGTPSVILSLWEVGDDSTKDLFVNYYSKLSKDRSEKYAPLRDTQLQMIESGKYSNPYFWAPFVFIGERGSKF